MVATNPTNGNLILVLFSIGATAYTNTIKIMEVGSSIS